jgi:PAS domain S-box-containing protein
LLAPLDPRYQGLDMSNQPYFQEAKGRAGAVISQPFLSPRTGQPTVYMAWALANGSEVIGELNLAALQEAIEAERSRAGKDSVFILDRSGTVLAHPSSRLVQQQANLGHQEIVRHGLEGETTLAHAADGSLALCSTAQVARTGWLVVAQMPLSAAIGPYALTMGLALSVSLTFWLALAWIIRRQLGRHVVAPLAQLRRGTAALTAGDFSQGGTLAEIPAAFAEIRELAADFHHMSQALQARQVALQRSEERYRSLFDGVPVGLYRTTPAGQFLDTNPAFVHMLRYLSQESLRALNAADVYADPDDRKYWQAVIEREGIVRDFEARLRRFDGTIIWVNNAGRVVRADNGEVLCYEGSMADITERKRAEEAPAAELRVAALSGMVLVVDDDEMVRHICRSTVEHFGFRALTAADGEEAVRVFREHADEIICVILDLTMPRMDGVAAFNELGRIRPGVRAILSSGYNEQEAIQRFGERGIAGFIQKPYRIASLRVTLERVLGGAL